MLESRVSLGKHSLNMTYADLLIPLSSSKNKHTKFFDLMLCHLEILERFLFKKSESSKSTVSITSYRFVLVGEVEKSLFILCLMSGFRKHGFRVSVWQPSERPPAQGSFPAPSSPSELAPSDGSFLFHSSFLEGKQTCKASAWHPADANAIHGASWPHGLQSRSRGVSRGSGENAPLSPASPHVTLSSHESGKWQFLWAPMRC